MTAALRSHQRWKRLAASGARRDGRHERGRHMYVSIRQYRSDDVQEVARRAQGGFVPIVRDVAGFSAYYIVDGGEGTFTTITVAEDKAGVEEFVNKAREWVRENAADLVDGAPTVTNGEVVAHG